MLPDTPEAGVVEGGAVDELLLLPPPFETATATTAPTAAIPATIPTFAPVEIPPPVETDDCETVAFASRPWKDACTWIEKGPVHEFICNRGMRAWPASSVVTVEVLSPLKNAPPGPSFGSRKTTTAPATGLWFSSSTLTIVSRAVRSLMLLIAPSPSTITRLICCAATHNDVQNKSSPAGTAKGSLLVAIFGGSLHPVRSYGASGSKDYTRIAHPYQFAVLHITSSELQWVNMKLFATALVAAALAFAGMPEVDKAKALGNPSAPIVVEVFASYDCPHCAALHHDTIPLLMKDFVAPGKMYLINREFPLTGQYHPYAMEAATYATAAARVGKYQQVSSALFTNQATWAVNGKVWDTVATALTPAEQQKVQALVKDPAVVAEVKREYDEGMAAGISGTPTLIITH